MSKNIRQFAHREKLLTKGQNTLSEKMFKEEKTTYDDFKDVSKFNINKKKFQSKIEDCLRV